MTISRSTGTLLLGCILASAVQATAAQASEPLTLSEAETIAIERDAVGEQLRLEATAGREAAQAAAVLPDPEIRFG
ncbi:MAG: hypothetical protein R3217_03565, partial [Gammaproteobacteria bacterium]|nr:hypothetical protein [Gammaproteobacteria bacterium]